MPAHRKAARATPSAPAPRALAVAAFAYLALVFLTARRPGPHTWGIDTLGYFHGPVRIVLAAILVVAAVLILLATRAGATSGSRSFRVPAAIVVLGSAAATIALWSFRVRSLFLGDQMVWIQNLASGQFPLYAEPLAAVLWRGYVVLLHAFRVPVTGTSLAILPLACGLAAALLSWKISGLITVERRARVLAFVLVLTLGTAQLYAGYVESYPIFGVAVLSYVLAALRFTRRQGSATWVGVALALTIATHLAGLFLLPSYFVLIYRSPQRLGSRIALILVPIATAVGVGWLIGVDPADLLHPFQTLRTALRSPAAPGTTAGSSLLRPLGEFGNLIFLVMPVPALLLLARLLPRKAQSKPAPSDPSQRLVREFLAWATVGGTAAAALLSIPGSPAQDWDLLSILILPAALLAIHLGIGSEGTAPSRRLALGLGSLATASLLTFLLVNASEKAGTSRFKTLVSPGSVMSAHERAYANEKLVKYYTARKEFDSVYVYAQRAQAAEPGNTRYWDNIGTALYNLHRYEQAAGYFEEAIRRGSDRPEVYYNLGLCYTRMGRFEEAVKNIETAIRVGTEDPKYLNSLGLAMLGAGDSAGAYRVWSYVLKQWPGFEPTQRAFQHYFGTNDPKTPPSAP